MANSEWDHRSCPALAFFPVRYSLFTSYCFAFNAAHTFCGVAGIVRSLLPIASVIALMTAGGEPIAPASPQPLIPSGFDGHGVFEVETLNEGRSSARGMV